MEGGVHARGVCCRVGEGKQKLGKAVTTFTGLIAADIEKASLKLTFV